MGFCIKCGSTLAEGAHFCGNCGVEIGEAHTESGQRKTVYDGEVYKCPNCAEILNSFMPFCPSCGYELRGAKGASVVKEFAEKLEKIEKTREIPKRDFFTGILAVLDEEKLNKTDEGKINLIRSFSIPNTKEDILEFMILAASNIDLKLYGKENTAGINSPQRSISDAWLAKFEQAYEKAKFSFYGYPDFMNIKEIYEKKMIQLEEEKRRKKNSERNSIILLVAIFVVLIILGLLQEYFSL
ncbi:zinc ribbon domain-containing protein [Streptococcus parasanguinis]|uniref:zinc ribbon domain-containing protein n=1 Tax=Streptococcus parasanguinis TaxID=1318 RepID=UPI00066E00F6|nr:zinc ribbon domain-containing protein [Streptococcus parasanguinis]RHK66625.1 zinc ribbon domain-containing protein [Streptococcus parasanguinis]